ncbi:MAG: hypothetical protein HQL94_05405 [Magnetococcales bacterium]|nr:hypothetical protein [Magnetococcales bacterium]
MISGEAMQSYEKYPILIFDVLQLLMEQFSLDSPNDYEVSAYFMLLSQS